MKYAKMLGLAVVAAMALTALLGASSASATVLCKTTPVNGPTGTPFEECNSKYASGQVYKFKSTLPTLNSTPDGTFDDVVCDSSETSIKQTSAGGATSTVNGEVTALTFTGCEAEESGFGCTATAVGLPFKGGEIHWIADTEDGTVTIANGKVQVKCAFSILNCVFGAKVLDMRLDGGNPAKVTTEGATVEMEEELGFEQCPEEAHWEATYVATSPTAIYVAKT